MWKYVLIGIVALIGFIYASPILFPSDHAIQITPQGKSVVDEKVLQTINAQFKENGIIVKEVEAENNRALYRFKDAATQLKAIDIVRQTIGEENYVSALNLAATTPAWLRYLHASPMYMGLDLRGGVHFLMEVDMEAALKKALNNYKETFRNELINKKIKYKGIATSQGHGNHRHERCKRRHQNGPQPQLPALDQRLMGVHPAVPQQVDHVHQQNRVGDHNTRQQQQAKE